MPIFDNSVISRRQNMVGAAIEKEQTVLIVAAGEQIGKPGGLDQTYPFLPHPDYYWLTGSRRSGGIIVYASEKGWIHFVRQADAVERLWEGEPEIPEGDDAAKFPNWLKTHSGKDIALLGNHSSPLFNSIKVSSKLNDHIKEKIDSIRRIKDAAEISLIKKAILATAAGFKKAREVIQPGISERKIQIEMEAEMLRQGADGMAFGSIVGTGAHTAVLHFEPGERQVKENDLVLVDSGAEINEYCADVTRTYSASGKFTAEQKAIYDLVLTAQKTAISKCKPGTEWHDVHRTAAATLAQGLVDLGVLRGSLTSLLETAAISLFFPHGIGHMVGLMVRDVGGRVPGRPEGRICCGARVRVDLPLEEGFLMTIEPGLYFVPAILDNKEFREKHKNAVAWDSLERWRKVGGVRIEDDILITTQGPEVLTSMIPK